MDRNRLRAKWAAQVAYAAIPEALRAEMALSREFKERAEIQQTTTLTFEPGGLVLDLNELFERIRDLFGGKRRASIRDQNSEDRWTLTLAKGGIDLRIHRGKTEHFYPLAFAFSPEPAVRQAGLSTVATDSELTTSERTFWEMRFVSSPIADEEAHELDDLIRASPARIEARLHSALHRKTVSLDQLVPEERSYYERLVGVVETSGNIQDYLQTEGRALAAQWVRQEVRIAAARLFRFAAHPDAAKLMLDVLGPDATFGNATAADPMSRVARLEYLTKARPTEDAEIVDAVKDVEGLIGEESVERDLLSALFIFVEGAIARAGVLDEAPPFWRRLASLAHAAVIFRQLPPGLRRDDRFREHLLGHSRNIFAITSMLDLREEPRWMPTYAEGEHFRGEFLGRVAGALRVACDEREGREVTSELKTHAEEVFAVLSTKMGVLAFLTGPCEAGIAPRVDLDEESRQSMEEGLRADPPEAAALTELFVRSLLLKIPPATVELAASALQALSRRAHDPTVMQKVSPILPQLAGLAAVARHRGLAEQIRVLCRVARRQSPPQITPNLELEAGLIASAANRDFADYATELGNWISEISQSTLTAETAGHLAQVLRFVTYRRPALWPYLAPALNAAEAVS